jgi:hypothetical protein
MPDWLKPRSQTKIRLLALQVGGFAQGQHPCHVKNKYVTETSKKDMEKLC